MRANRFRLAAVFVAAGTLCSPLVAPASRWRTAGP